MARYQLSHQDKTRTGVIIEDHVYLQKNGLVTVTPDLEYVAAQGLFEAVPVTRKEFTQAWLLIIERTRAIAILGVVDNRVWRLDPIGFKILPNIPKIIGLLAHHHPALKELQVPSQFYHHSVLVSRDMVVYQSDEAETLIYPESVRLPILNHCDVINAGNLMIKHGGTMHPEQYYPLVIDRSILGYVGKINGSVQFRKTRRQGNYLKTLLKLVTPHFAEV